MYYANISPKVKYAPPSEKMCRIAEKFLFPEITLSKEFQSDFRQYVTDHFERLGCCVLWSRNPELVSIFDKHGLPSIEKKEVKMVGKSIKGSVDYQLERFYDLA